MLSDAIYENTQVSDGILDKQELVGELKQKFI